MKSETAARSRGEPGGGEKPLSLSPEVIRTEQRNDAVIGPIIKLIEAGDTEPSWTDVESSSVQVQQLWAQLATLELVDGVLYRQYQSPDGTVIHYQLVVPRSLRMIIMEHVHADVTSGHFGTLKSQKRLKNYAYWSGWNG